jgi:hypothetical protein
MKEKKEFIKALNIFFNRKVKRKEMIFYECDSLKIIKLILELEKIVSIPKKMSFISKEDLYEIIFR